MGGGRFIEGSCSIRVTVDGAGRGQSWLAGGGGDAALRFA